MDLKSERKEGGGQAREECPSILWDLKLLRATGEGMESSDSDSFEPEYHQIKKLGLKPNSKKIKSGGWSPYENSLYLRFILKHLQEFETERGRRRNKVFYRLSKILRRRTPDQCRSHHQKLQLKHGENLAAIISEVQRKIQVAALHELSKRQQPSLGPAGSSGSIYYKPVVDGGWFSICAWRNCLRLSIDCESIEQW